MSPRGMQCVLEKRAKCAGYIVSWVIIKFFYYPCDVPQDVLYVEWLLVGRQGNVGAKTAVEQVLRLKVLQLGSDAFGRRLLTRKKRGNSDNEADKRPGVTNSDFVSLIRRFDRVGKIGG